jgi:steroid 5-alpha reductase family enzyme
MLADIAPGFGTNLAATAMVLLACVLILWAISIRIADMSIIDIFWGPGFGIVAGVGFLLSANAIGGGYRRILVTVLTVAWAARLGGYLWRRNHGKGEDPRYTAAFRNRIQRNLHWHTLTRVFLLQGALIWLISMPVQLAQYLVRPATFGIPGYLGLALWIIGFAFEAISDSQLASFKADPANRGSIMDRGLWRYTRHPNYFGNACLWWGLWLIACDNRIGVATVFAPVLMTHFLLNVTGKSLLERRMSRSRPGYADYVARTSGFFPWPPKSR